MRIRFIRLGIFKVRELCAVVEQRTENMVEIWKPIIGFDGCMVSNMGNVKGKMGRLLKLQKHPRGYLTAAIGTRPMLVHRLVMLAFSPIIDPDTHEVNHRDTNKHNNRLDNLEWCTKRENMDHAFHHGLTTQRRLSNAVVETIRSMRRSGHRGIDIAKQFGIHKATVTHICKGRYHRPSYQAVNG